MNEILERARALGFPAAVASDLGVAGIELSWSRAVQHANPRQLQELSKFLDQEERRRARSRTVEDRTPGPDPQSGWIRDMVADANRAAEHAASPAGQAERLIRSNEMLASELAKQRR